MACSADQYREPLLRYAEARDSGSPDLARLEAEALAANLGIARSFAWSAARGRAHREDVEAAASLALVESMRTWTPDGGASLSTWAMGPIRAEVRKVKELSQAVRVPAKTHRAAREIAESGEDVDAACERMGKRASNVKAALSIRTCELTADLGAASIEASIFEAEMESLLAGAAACWRGPEATERLLRAAESLARRRAELLTGDKVTDDTRALAETFWPSDDEERIRVLARLDYALAVAHRGRTKPRQQATSAVDVECWRAHFVEGELWTEIGEWLGGVSRSRAQNRAKRVEKWIAKAIRSAADVPDDALAIWARRPPEVAELERLGVLDVESDPVTILYAVEDLEVALTEIDPRIARAWSARASGRSPVEIAASEGVGRKTIRAWLSQADAALRELLQAVTEAAQLDLFGESGPMRVSESWWSPLAKDAATTITSFRDRVRSAVRGRLATSARRLAASVRGAAAGLAAQLGAGPVGESVGCTGPPVESPNPTSMILRLQC